MKNIITITSLLAAGTALANAETIIVAEDFFGTSSQDATFKGGDWGKPFNGTWTNETGVFGADSTDFSTVWTYGLTRETAASWNAGTLYYGTANNNLISAQGNRAQLTYNAETGSVSIGNLPEANRGGQLAVFWNEITTEQLSSVTDLQLNFTSVKPSFDVAVFYLEDGSSTASDVKRLALENVTTESSQTLSLDVSQIAKTDEGALKGGKFVIAMRKLTGTWEYAGMNNLSWTGTVIPEPSTFGLLAGLGALALVAARRRRSRK